MEHLRSRKKSSTNFFMSLQYKKNKQNNNIQILPMEKKYKLNYDPPKVAMVSFVVEEGLQMSVRTSGF